MKKLIMALSAFFMNSCLIYGSNSFDGSDRSDRSVYCVQGSFVGYNKQFGHLLAQQDSNIVGEDNMHDIERLHPRVMQKHNNQNNSLRGKTSGHNQKLVDLLANNSGDWQHPAMLRQDMQRFSVDPKNRVQEEDIERFDFRNMSGKSLEEREAFRKKTFDIMAFGQNSIFSRPNSGSIALTEDKRTVESSSMHRENFQFESEMQPVELRQESCKKLEVVYNNVESNVSRQQNCQKLSLVYESIESEKPTVKNTPTHYVESESLSQEQPAKNCRSFLQSLFGLKRNKVYVDPDNK